MNEKTQNLEEVFSDLFKGGATGTGEEELLRVASKYSMQLSSAQMKCLLYLQFRADQFLESGKKEISQPIYSFVGKWLLWKEYNNSAGFIMRVIDFISLRRFLTEQSFKVDIKK